MDRVGIKFESEAQVGSWKIKESNLYLTIVYISILGVFQIENWFILSPLFDCVYLTLYKVFLHFLYIVFDVLFSRMYASPIPPLNSKFAWSTPEAESSDSTNKETTVSET